MIGRTREHTQCCRLLHTALDTPRPRLPTPAHTHTTKTLNTSSNGTQLRRMSSTDDLLPALVLILGTALLLTLLVAYAAYKCTTEQLRTAKVVPSAQADAPPAPPPPHPSPTSTLQTRRKFCKSSEATAALKGFRCRPSSPCAYDRTASPALTPSLQQETVGMGTSEAVAHLERVRDRRRC